MPSLSTYADDWEELAELDAMWAVLTHDEKRGNKWNRDDFSATGAAQVAATLERLTNLGWDGPTNAALDFGCGVGRMSRPLAEAFENVVGVDISERMVELARQWSAEIPNVEFSVNRVGDLRLFEAAQFDLVHTFLVLQHMPSAEIAMDYVREFERVLRPGGVLVFDLPVEAPRPHILRARRTLYRVMRSMGFGAPRLHGWGLTSMTMISVPAPEVDRFIADRRLEVLLVDSRKTGKLVKNLYYLRKRTTTH